ncbi:MAG: M14 family metallopeptidase [Psychroserpens sp.]|nr:M14 family metallopeptidase [Psychroserpens sp.]
MKKLFLCVILFASCTSKPKQSEALNTVFETSEGTETATYKETIDFYTNLAELYPEVNMKAMGLTDSGEPLHIVTLNKDRVFDFEKIRKNDQRILLIMNGIHPGESDGIDATMLLFRDLVNGSLDVPEHTVLVTIPIYNIGGSLNRNNSTRTNQNGPKSYGFRGNARNYDLNRDFIKSDTKNAQSFAEIFHLIQPDVFIDNHVSNGADYQYTLTHLFTQHNKLGGELGGFLQEQMMPKLEEKLKENSWDITPYVNVYNRVPDDGFTQFMDYPRYSTGYTTLWNTLGMMVETHMLKPYKQRVEGTYELMKQMIAIIEEDHEIISQLRTNQLSHFEPGNTYPLSWKVDTTKTTTLQFKGYEGTVIESEITGAQRLKYDRSKPFTKSVSYQNYFEADHEIKIPNYYVIPKQWHEVIHQLKLNNIEMRAIKADTSISVESYKIKTYETRKNPYEGHYPHYNTEIESSLETFSFSEGDLIIDMRQSGVRYLLETLEPEATDSFFNWNYFDTILQQKEGFSAYVWEDKAKLVLRQNPNLQIKFNLKKTFDEDFANNWYAQLEWIHKQSVHYEKAHLQYPIYRIN